MVDDFIDGLGWAWAVIPVMGLSGGALIALLIIVGMASFIYVCIRDHRIKFLVALAIVSALAAANIYGVF